MLLICPMYNQNGVSISVIVLQQTETLVFLSRSLYRVFLFILKPRSGKINRTQLESSPEMSLHIAKLSDQIILITDVSYPKSVVPGTCAEGRPIRGNTQGTDAVLMSEQNRDPCSFENIPNIYGVVVIASEQQPP